MLDELKHMAARRLSKRPRRERVELQAQLDQWNGLAAAWAVQCSAHPRRAVKRELWAADLRRSAEWALMDETVEIKESRRLVGVLARELRRFERLRFDPVEIHGFTPQDIAFPATMEALAKEFDAREYAAMMQSFAE